MKDEPWKRYFEDAERLTRLLDPLRNAGEQLRALQDPLHGVKEQFAALLYDPLNDIREQMKAIVDPLRDLREQGALGAPDEVANRMQAILAPLNEAQEWVKAFKSDQAESLRELSRFADPLRDLRERGAFGASDELAKQMQAILAPLNEAQDWVKAFKSVEEERLREFSTLFDDFSRQLRDMPDEVRSQLAVLMDRGWCLDPEMPHTWGRDLVEAFEQGEEKEAQQWLADYFRGRLDEIENTLVERHPSRAKIIAEAFKAHREGRFDLSIPVLLAQADGVAHDNFQRQLFSQVRTHNLTEFLGSLPPDDMRAIFLAAFYVDIPLTRNTKKLPKEFDGLNRHAVLHGTDPNYGTEINSLRAISILNLASYLVSERPNGHEGAE